MNYLAHLHIADHTRTSLAGALAADFVRGSLPEDQSPMLLGMRLHRFVDNWIDRHPEVLGLKHQFDPSHRRMAGILLDMAFDHQLARHWPDYHHWPLEQFSQHCYAQLLQAHTLPEKLASILPFMSRDDWLARYQQRSGIQRSLEGIARRMSQPDLLQKGIPEIWRLEPEIHQAFNKIYPALLQASQEWLTLQAQDG